MIYQKISSSLHDRRGAIATIAILIGMAIIGLGIIVSSQLSKNERVNISPRAASAIDPLWAKSKVSPVTGLNIWSGAGPTAGWESYLGNRVYICNGKTCWTLDRSTSPPTFLNEGVPFEMDTDPNYKDLLPADNSDIKPWSNGGPTSAWTWDITYNGQAVNETLICNGSFCWRYIRNPDGSGEWRDGKKPIDLSKLDFWKNNPELYTNNGPSVAWTDPVNKKVTLCNGSYCMSLSYSPTFKWIQKVSPFPSGVTSFTSAWTSPATKTITLCDHNTCYPFNLLPPVGYTGEVLTIGVAPSSTPVKLSVPTLTCTVTGTTVKWTWAPVTGTTSYFLDVKGNDGSSWAEGWIGDKKEFTVQGKNNITYTARAQAGDGLRQTGTWSNSSSCTTVAAPPSKPPTITNVSWTPVSPEASKTITFTATGTDPDSNKVNVMIYVKKPSSNTFETYLPLINTSVSGGKWTATGQIAVPGTSGIYSIYGEVNDGSNPPVKGSTYTYTVLVPSVTRTWNFNFSAQCANGVVLTAAQYPIDLYSFNDDPTTQTPITVTSRQITISGRTGTTFYVVAQVSPGGTPLVPKTYPTGMNMDNGIRLKWIGANVAAGTQNITVTATGSLCNVSTGSLKVTIPGTVPAEGGWRRITIGNNLPWRVSGTTEPNIPVAVNVSVEFKELSGYTKPNPINGIHINPNQTVEVSATSGYSGGQTSICLRKAAGDADCNGKIEYVDFVCWRGELNKKKPVNCKSANFVDPAGGSKDVVDGADYSAWLATFKKENKL